MNKKSLIYIFFLVPILCASCNWFNKSDRQENKELKAIEVFPDSVRQYLIEQDSLKRGLISKIDMLTTELNASKEEMEQLQSEIKELKSPGRILFIIAFLSLLLSFIAIAISIFKIGKKADRWEVKDSLRSVKDQVRNLEYRMTRAESIVKEIGKESSTAKATSSNSFADRRFMDFELRLSKIEKNQSGETSNPPSYNPPSMETKVAQEPEVMKIGYAKVNSSKYFVEIFNSKQEDCVYTIKFTSKDEGEFDIISLDKIKSINGIKDVVELASNSCLLEEASTYIVVEKGRCKRADETVWEVTKKLLIKVTR